MCAQNAPYTCKSHIHTPKKVNCVFYHSICTYIFLDEVPRWRIQLCYMFILRIPITIDSIVGKIFVVCCHHRHLLYPIFQFMRFLLQSKSVYNDSTALLVSLYILWLFSLYPLSYALVCSMFIAI